MTYLSIDLGSKTVGLAISYSGQLAQNLFTMRFKENDYDDCMLKIGRILDEFKPQIVIIGLPINMDDSLGERALISKQFGDTLIKNFDVIVEYLDERLTTVNALNILKGKNPKKRKRLVDNVSAMLILQEYLDNIKGKK